MKKLLFIVIVLGGVAAYVTNPNQAQIQDRVDQMLQTAITDGQLEDIKDPGAAVLLVLCKSDAPACAQMLRQALDVHYTDLKLFTTVRATGFGKAATCYAAFTQLICPGGLAEA